MVPAVQVDTALDRPLTIVSKWSIEAGARIVIATVGSFVNEYEVFATETAGVVSQGRVCDEALLGWSAGDPKTVATVPRSFLPGEPAPDSRPGKSR